IELNNLYANLKHKNLFNDDLCERLSAPLLLKIPDKWYASKKRVLVVGQETLGWEFKKNDDEYCYYAWPYDDISNFSQFKMIDNSIQALVEGYQKFEFAKYQPKNHRSPFWRAYRQIRTYTGEDSDGFNTSVLWTNLFRMSIDGGSVYKNGNPQEIESMVTLSGSVLRNEIQILNPSAIIFFIGPNYDEYLQSMLPGSDLITVKNHDSRALAKIKAAELPQESFRTYHPAYLQRKTNDGYWRFIDEMCGEF
ncbi:MAG: hypothetical protein KGJ76_14990, partial [Betaproteobacteria bacterium]|nr:hypothetical protein [Betaproteobacteria bacterium]